MAVNFSSLLKKPAGEAVRPPALPAGDYPGVIKSFEYGDNNKNKTPYVRFAVGLTGWPDGVPDDEKSVNGAAIDLSKKSLRRDYYLTDDAMWRLDAFLRSVGLEPKGRTYEEVIPEAVGTRVIAQVQQYMNEKNSEIGNQIGDLTGQP